MRSFSKLVCSVVALACLSSQAFAQPGEGERPPGGPGGERGPGGDRGRGGPSGMDRGGFMRMMPVFAALDKDQDGELSAEEINNAVAALKTLDKDNDGKLSADEMRPDMSAMGGRGGFMGGAGGPGAPGGGRPNGDTAGSMADRMFAYDENKDEKLAKTELPERIQQMFDRFDTNKDGFLTRDELNAAPPRDGNRPRPE